MYFFWKKKKKKSKICNILCIFTDFLSVLVTVYPETLSSYEKKHNLFFSEDKNIDQEEK